MKLLKNRAVAVLVLVAAIVLSSLYGLSKKPAVEGPGGGPPLDESLSTAYYQDFIVDEANVLSAKTEKSLCLYNANWDQLDSVILAQYGGEYRGRGLGLGGEPGIGRGRRNPSLRRWGEGRLRGIQRPALRPLFLPARQLCKRLRGGTPPAFGL